MSLSSVLKGSQRTMCPYPYHGAAAFPSADKMIVKATEHEVSMNMWKFRCWLMEKESVDHESWWIQPDVLRLPVSSALCRTSFGKIALQPSSCSSPKAISLKPYSVFLALINTTSPTNHPHV